MIAKGLFDVNMESLFCGEISWVMIMKIAVKIIITLAFFEYFFIKSPSKNHKPL